MLYLGAHLLRSAEGHSGLGADGAPEGQVIAILALDHNRVNALGLDRVEDGDPDLDEVGDDSLWVAVGW